MLLHSSFAFLNKKTASAPNFAIFHEIFGAKAKEEEKEKNIPWY